MYYLDPKNDLTFKKVFAENPRVLISFLNALLPLPENEPITEIEYMPSEILPDLPKLKNTIVDIRCKDRKGRQILVEMQIIWSDSFTTRVLYNASKAFSQQIQKGDSYFSLLPVYSLSIVNQRFSEQNAQWYHHFCLSHQGLTNWKIPGLSFVFLEIPNFMAENYVEKRVRALWMRFLKEIKDNTTMIADELLEVPEIAEAIGILNKSSYSKAELMEYEKYWDVVRTQQAFIQDAEARGEAKGEFKTAVKTAEKLKIRGMTPVEISEITGLSMDEINLL